MNNLAASTVKSWMENPLPQRPLPHAARTSDLILKMGKVASFPFSLTFLSAFCFTPASRSAATPALSACPRSDMSLLHTISPRRSPANWAPLTRKLESSACTVCVCHLLFLNTIVYYFPLLSPGDGGDPPFHERKEKAFPDHCVVMSQETHFAAHCVTSPNPTKSVLKKLL